MSPYHRTAMGPISNAMGLNCGWTSMRDDVRVLR
jgi:hypothetical protein